LTPAQPQLPDLNFDLTTPQIGDQVAVSCVISDPKRLLSTQILLPHAMAKQFARALMMAADKAEKQLVVPQPQIAKA
jgi:hypothetical protein